MRIFFMLYLIVCVLISVEKREIVVRFIKKRNVISFFFFENLILEIVWREGESGYRLRREGSNSIGKRL